MQHKQPCWLVPSLVSHDAQHHISSNLCYLLITSHAGTSLGNKAMEIAEKVVMDAAQELKKEVEDYDGGSLPSKFVIWTMEEVDFSWMLLLAICISLT